jgi:NhaP-type Na+/H+ or K+/H+ antiporter
MGEHHGMALDSLLLAVGVLGVVVAALSSRIRTLPVSEPLLALLIGVLIGTADTDLLAIPTLLEDHGRLHEATRLLLAVSVMSVALRYPITAVRRQQRPVLILLLVGMPLMALVSAGLAWATLGIPLAAAALLGAAVCPTDPVLASSAVTGKPAETDLPARDRQVLSLESGANDGLALPFVLAAIAMAGPLSGPAAVTESLWQVGVAVVLGVVAGWLGARALDRGEEHGTTDTASAIFFTLVLAFAVIGAAGLLKADGVLAVFAAGLAFNHASTGRDRAGAVSIDEAVNRFVVLPVFVLLGAMLPWEAWRELGWPGPALALSVMLLRRIPALMLLRRALGIGRADALYLGWFGPVGVSALFYLTLEAQRIGVDETVLSAGSLIVTVSTIAHGLTGSLGRRMYRRAQQRRRPDDAAAAR